MIRRFLGDDDHNFRLGIAQAEELQDTFGIGLMPLYERISQLCVRELRETVRLALIGGGMEGEKASRHAKRYVVEGELVKAAAIAGEAVEVLMRGKPEDPSDTGEAMGEMTSSILSPAARSDIPASMETAEP